MTREKLTLAPAQVESVTTSKGTLIIKVKTARGYVSVHVTPTGLVRFQGNDKP